MATVEEGVLMVIIPNNPGALKLTKREPYAKTSLHSSKKALGVLGILFMSVIHGGGSYSFSKERSIARLAGKEIRVRGEMVRRGSAMRKTGYYDVLLYLQTVDGRKVTISVSSSPVLCGTFGAIHAVSRAKRGDEVEAFGKVTGRNEISLCGSAGYYLKVIGKDETMNWLLYRSEKYGFKVKYPRSWTVREASGYVGFRDHGWDQAKIKGDSITIKIFRNIPREEAIRKSPFQTKEEAIERGDLPHLGIGEGKYFTRGDSAGAAEQAVETTINGLPALFAEVPVRLYGGEEDKYIGASSGESVLLFGDGVYASIKSWGPVDLFDLFVSTFKLVGNGR